MSGDADPAKVKLSEGDIARVAQLYPKADGSSRAMQQSNNWKPQKGSKLRRGWS